MCIFFLPKDSCICHKLQSLMIKIEPFLEQSVEGILITCLLYTSQWRRGEKSSLSTTAKCQLIEEICGIFRKHEVQPVFVLKHREVNKS